jgi:hypothetical protein
LRDENWSQGTTIVISNVERNLTSNITKFSMLFSLITTHSLLLSILYSLISAFRNEMFCIAKKYSIPYRLYVLYIL